MIEHEPIGAEIHGEHLIEVGGQSEGAAWVRWRTSARDEQIERGLRDRDEARVFAYIAIEAATFFESRTEALTFARALLWARQRGRTALVRRLRHAAEEWRAAREAVVQHQQTHPKPVEVSP